MPTTLKGARQGRFVGVFEVTADGKPPCDARDADIERGLPIGGDLEYADEATLSRALEGRGHVE